MPLGTELVQMGTDDVHNTTETLSPTDIHSKTCVSTGFPQGSSHPPIRYTPPAQ